MKDTKASIKKLLKRYDMWDLITLHALLIGVKVGMTDIDEIIRVCEYLINPTVDTEYGDIVPEENRKESVIL